MLSKPSLSTIGLNGLLFFAICIIKKAIAASYLGLHRLGICQASNEPNLTLSLLVATFIISNNLHQILIWIQTV